MRAKNDEFYTQYYDIEKEMNAYLEYDWLRLATPFMAWLGANNTTEPVHGLE
jgi:hypothetical protein